MDKYIFKKTNSPHIVYNLVEWAKFAYKYRELKRKNRYNFNFPLSVIDL